MFVLRCNAASTLFMLHVQSEEREIDDREDKYQEKQHPDMPH